jgi:hypothetical protein
MIFLADVLVNIVLFILFCLALEIIICIFESLKMFYIGCMFSTSHTHIKLWIFMC